jgi:two-component sensor histidine kinase
VRGQRFKTSKLTLEVKADEGVAIADISVSLGLIVTELVINALSMPFPRDVAAASLSDMNHTRPTGRSQ